MNKNLTDHPLYSEQARLWDDLFAKGALTDIDDLLYNNKYSSVKHSPYLPIVLKYAGIEDKILESGCGIGQWLIYLLKKGYHYLYGIDFAEKTINLVKSKFPKINYKVGDIRNSLYSAEYFDVILSWSVVDHLEPDDQMKAIQDYGRILKKGGYLFISLPYKNILHFSPILYFVNFLKKNTFLRNLLGLNPYKRNFIQYFYTKKHVQKLLFSANLSIKTILPTGHEVGFERPINAHLFKNSKIFHKNKKDEWAGLSLSGSFICNSLKKISLWITPDEIFILAQKQ